MPNLELNVTLVNGSLNVDQSGNANQMGHGQSGTIIWKLTGNASSGTFNAMDASNPGFAWKQSTPSGVFGQPTSTHQGKHIEVSDTNTDPNGVTSSGEWVYQLFATVGGVTYSTMATSGRVTIETITDPTIKNN